ncbi:MAG: hypothetical protein IJ088_15055 [Clostridia bacterium]|nr:hypothetical protein [Clostridia bacterium]
MSGSIARTKADEILEQGITIGISRGKEEGRIEGRIEGKVIGADELANALEYLYQHDREDEAREAVRDKAVRARIMKEYRSGQGLHRLAQ